MAVLAAIGIGLGVVGSMQQADAVKESARYNEAQAKEDVKLIQLSEKQALRDTRFQGASDLANIQATSAASGVSVSTGSALDAIRFQAEQNARNEFAVGMESRVAQQNRLAGASLETVKAKSTAQGIYLGAASSALSTGTSYYAASKG